MTSKQPTISNFFKKKSPPKLWTEVKPTPQNVRSSSLLSKTKPKDNKDYIKSKKTLTKANQNNDVVVDHIIPIDVDAVYTPKGIAGGDVMPPTPESIETCKFINSKDKSSTPINPTKNKVDKINNFSKKLKLQKSKLNNGSKIVDEVPTFQAKLFNGGTAKSTKKLSLSKPLKRRCSFSPPETVDSKRKIDKRDDKVLKVPIIDITDDSDFISGYVNGDQHNIKEKYEHEMMTLVKVKNADTSNAMNDSLLDLMDDDVEHLGGNKNSNKSLDDSFLGIDFDDDIEHINLLDNNNKAFLTWKVQDVRKSVYEQNSGFKVMENILTLKQERGNIFATCHLRDDWCRMEIEENDIVYVSALSNKKLTCVLDNKCIDHITLYPNTLISGTSIAAGITCERLAVLNERFKMDDQNEAMLLGTMIHDLFDWTLQTNKFTAPDLEKRVREMLRTINSLESLYAIDSDETEMLAKIREYFSPIEQWSNSFLKQTLGKEMDFKTGRNSTDHDSITSLHINKIVDIEENIWSPVYGLKGRIDASVNVTVHKRPKLKLNGMKTKDNYTLPLELKTGKLFSKLGSIEHRAQVAVYTLLMSEKYKSLIDTGLLYYIKANHLQGVPRPEQEKRAIIIKRNEIARKLTLEKKDFTMPGLLRNERQCKRCYQKNNCMLYFKSMENGVAWTSGVDELFEDITSHLASADLIYFSKWYKLSMLEAFHDATKSKDRYIWLDSSDEREKRGFCFSKMTIKAEQTTSDGKIHYKFEKANNGNYSLLLLPMGVGDRVIISEESSKVYNITTGYIVNLTSEEITISAHHKITKVNNTEIYSYRIDKDDTLSNYTTPLTNICKLFDQNSAKSSKLRNLIIKGDSPKFSEDKAIDISSSQLIAKQGLLNTFKASQGKALNTIFSNLNTVQKSAIEKCLVAEDYVLILGMPGAGKSTTTACLVRALVSMGKSVLLTSYTHSAVDTILLKLLDVDFNKFLRIGIPSRIHPKIAPFSCYERTKSFTSTHELRGFYNSQNVVATTCLGINHPIFKHKSFDYCIVDEASQITQPVCIGPIKFANTFVLVGDHNQLPPLVQSKEARENGLDVSLFRALSELNPKAVVTLDHQYRMNESIMLLTNKLIYGDRMKCGNEQVASSVLQLPFYDDLCNGNEKEFYAIINPKQPVVFVDTDKANMKEQKSAAHLVNSGEARIVKKIIDLLLKNGLNCRDVGVISPYRHQLKVIREEIANLISSTGGFVEVDTIDKYQGKDKTCIIVSLVRSNCNNEVGELLKDWRRVNVAITRAKRKLILIGSKKTLIASDIFRKLIDIVDSKDWCIPLLETID